MLLTYGYPPWNKGEQRSRGSMYIGIYYFLYKDINLPRKDQDPVFLISQKGEKERKAFMLNDREMKAIIEAKSNSVHVRINQKSQENSQKRANTDTRIRRVQKEAKDPKPKPEKSSLSQIPVKHWCPQLDQTATNEAQMIGEMIGQD
ncbi:hypothetical protein Tco_1149621 [Tanacetum coccineum]